MTNTFSSTPTELEFPTPDFRFEDCSGNRWNGNSPVKSHFWNALSSLLPNLEAGAIKSVLPHISSIIDKKLCIETRQFCTQESVHLNTHSRFNSMHLHSAYPLIVKLESWDRFIVSLCERILPARLFLALFVAIEHWTAVISDRGLQDPNKWFSNCDPTMFDLWEWHAIEELAHKSVCHDVFRHGGGGYFLRALGMIIALCWIMLPGLCFRIAYFYWKDGILFKPSTYTALFPYLFNRDGVLSSTFSQFIQYFNPRFRPWNVNSLPLILAYRDKVNQPVTRVLNA